MSLFHMLHYNCHCHMSLIFIRPKDVTGICDGFTCIMTKKYIFVQASENVLGTTVHLFMRQQKAMQSISIDEN